MNELNALMLRSVVRCSLLLIFVTLSTNPHPSHKHPSFYHFLQTIAEAGGGQLHRITTKLATVLQDKQDVESVVDLFDESLVDLSEVIRSVAYKEEAIAVLIEEKGRVEKRCEVADEKMERTRELIGRRNSFSLGAGCDGGGDDGGGEGEGE